MAQIDFVATCTRGAEEVLAAELRALGLRGVEVDRGAVRFVGELAHGYRACLWSRIASRVLLVVDRIRVPHADGLFDGAAQVDWPRHVPAHRSFRVDFVGGNPEIRNTRFGAQVTKDAILSRYDGRVPRVDVKEPEVRVHVHLRNDQAQIAIDMAGDPLHLRTPGREGGEAPLRENLAAALLHLADWPALVEQGAPLLDPMCGSGTFLAEAAGIARHVAPGLGRRRWGFIGWGGHENAVWQQEVQEAHSRGRAAAERPLEIHGADHSAEQIGRAQKNLGGLGFEDVLLSVKPLGDQSPPASGDGLLVVNPPYGERMGADEDLVPLYNELGNVLRRRFMGWSTWVLASERALAGAIGLRPARKIPIHNGPIECRWLSIPIRKDKVARDQ